jgi:hypothetical protein
MSADVQRTNIDDECRLRLLVASSLEGNFDCARRPSAAPPTAGAVLLYVDRVCVRSTGASQTGRFPTFDPSGGRIGSGIAGRAGSADSPRSKLRRGAYTCRPGLISSGHVLRGMGLPGRGSGISRSGPARAPEKLRGRQRRGAWQIACTSGCSIVSRSPLQQRSRSR